MDAIEENRLLRRALVIAHKSCLDRRGLVCCATGKECNGCVDVYLEELDDTLPTTK